MSANRNPHSIQNKYHQVPIEWNSIRLSGPAHGIVTKTVHKTLPGGGGGGRGWWGSGGRGGGGRGQWWGSGGGGGWGSGVV